MDTSKGKLFQLKGELNGAINGSVVTVDSFDDNHIYLSTLIPYQGDRKIRLPREGQVASLYLNELHLNVMDVLSGNVRIDLTGNKEGAGYNQIVAVKKKSKSNKFDIEVLKSIFTYIPLNTSGRCSYYKDGKTYELRKALGLNKKNKSNNTLKSKVIISDFNEKSVTGYYSEEFVFSNLRFKILDFKKSSKLFGFSVIKKEMIGGFFSGTKIEYKVDVKKSKEKENTITLSYSGKNIKFSLDDVKIIYPNISGWIEKKDKSIYSGSIVKVIKNKDIRFIRTGSECIVNRIKKVGDKKYAEVSIDNKKVYCNIKNLKLIKNLENNVEL